MSEPSAVEKAVKDLKDPRVRARGLDYLLSNPDPQSTEALWSYLPRLNLGRPSEVRFAARIIAVLGERGDARAVKAIVELLRKPLPEQSDQEIRTTALASLRALKGKHALPFLRAALFSEKWRGFEPTVAALLIDLGGAAEEDVFIRAVEMAGPAAKSAALTGLASMPGDRARSALERIAAEPGEFQATARELLDARAAGRMKLLEPMLPAPAGESLANVGGEIPTVLAPAAGMVATARSPEPARIPSSTAGGVSAPGVVASRRSAGAAESSAGRWERARQLLGRLDGEDRDGIIESLFQLFSAQAEPLRPEEFESCAALIAETTESLQSWPELQLRWVLLLAEISAGRLGAQPDLVRGQANAALRTVVGSDAPEEVARWAAASHQLDRLGSESPADTGEEKQRRKPWWKLW
jgi:hypothetical protein